MGEQDEDRASKERDRRGSDPGADARIGPVETIGPDGLDPVSAVDGKRLRGAKDALTEGVRCRVPLEPIRCLGRAGDTDAVGVRFGVAFEPVARLPG